MNISYLTALKDFRKQLEKKATLYIAFPGYQDLPYKMSEAKINVIYQLLRENSFTLLETSERYRFPDSLIFNAPYHLTKQGVDLRTSRLIEDI